MSKQTNMVDIYNMSEGTIKLYDQE